MGYSFKTKHKPGKENSAADALSRLMQYAVRAWEKSNYYSSIRATPFEALYGKESPTLVRGDAYQFMRGCTR